MRPRFPSRQAEADARTRAADDGIRDIHLQHGLKDHPFARGANKIWSRGAWSTFLRLLFAIGNHRQYTDFSEGIRIRGFPVDPLIHHEAWDRGGFGMAISC